MFRRSCAANAPRAEFAPALAEALASDNAAVIELRLDPEAITTRRTLSEIRAAARR